MRQPIVPASIDFEYVILVELRTQMQFQRPHIVRIGHVDERCYMGVVVY